MNKEFILYLRVVLAALIYLRDREGRSGGGTQQLVRDSFERSNIFIDVMKEYT